MKENFVKYLKSETAVYILFAYTFSILVRFIWFYITPEGSAFMNGINPEFIWNDQFMINTNDGYFWAEGARDLIAGLHQENDMSAIEHTASFLTAIFYWITPFSLETVIFYLPALLSSLVVIPVVLIGRALGQVHVGFIAALVASIAWSYYNRTMIGYFDTDMLNIVLPSFLLWSLVLAFVTQRERYFLFMALDIIAYRLWYPQSYALEFAFFGLILLYVLIFQRKNIYLIKLLTVMLLAMMGLPTIVRVMLVIAFYLISKKDFYNKYAYYFLLAVFILFLFTGGFDPIWFQLKSYVFRDSVEALDRGLSLHYLSVMQTVSEAGQIPFERFVNRISGHISIFFLSIIGFFWLVKEYKVMILSLPLIGLGFLAYGLPNPFEENKFLIHGGGLRFTIYAIVPLALGFAFLLVKMAKQLSIVVTQRNQKVFYNGLLVLGTLGVLFPNIIHVMDYTGGRPVMFKSEVETLDKLKNIASREDYTIAWWDYGYPIRFYSDTKTLIDGGKHSGEVNFPVSISLTQHQSVSAKMARLSVEANEKVYRDKKMARDKGEVDKYQETFMQRLFREEALTSTEDLITYLAKESSLPDKTRDIYYYLPQRMSRIFEVVDNFKSIDIVSGEKVSGIFFKQPIGQQDGRIFFTRNIYMLSNGDLYQGREKLHLKSVIKVGYDAQGKYKVQKDLQNIMGEYSLLIQGRSLYLLNNEALNSTYVQLFFLEQYDKRYFEPVIMSPYAKIYKLKI